MESLRGIMPRSLRSKVAATYKLNARAIHETYRLVDSRQLYNEDCIPPSSVPGTYKQCQTKTVSSHSAHSNKKITSSGKKSWLLLSRVARDRTRSGQNVAHVTSNRLGGSSRFTAVSLICIPPPLVTTTMPSARELAMAKIDRRHLHFAQRCISNLTFRIRLIVDHIDRNTKKIRESKDHSVKLIQFTESLYTTARETHMFRSIGNPERFTHRTGMISQVQEELNFVLKEYDDLRETMDYLLPEEAAKSEDHRDVLDMCDWRVNRCPELTEVVPLHRVHFVSFRESAAKHRRILGHLHGELAAFRLAEFEYDRTVVCPNQDHENSPDCPDSPQYTQLALDLVCHIVHHAYCYHVKRVSELEQFYCRLRSSLTALHLEIGLKIALIQHSADSQWLRDEALAEDMRRFVPAAIAGMIRAVGSMTSHPDYLPQTMHYLVSEAKWNSVQRDVET